MDVRMPDGTVITGVPEGTTKEQLVQKLRASRGNTTAGLIGKIGQGATFGLADELQAGLFAAPRALGNLIAGKEDASIGSAYNQLLESQRANLAAAQEQYPVASGVAELAGGLGTLGGIGAGTKLGRAVYSAGAKGLAPAAATKLGKAANLASKVGIGAGTGAATVGAYGFGTGEGGLGERLNEAQSSAVLGATVGGGLPLATSGVGAVGLALTPKIDEGFKEVGRLARKYNIPLSLEQLSSSRALKTAQKISAPLPFSGQAGFRDKQLSAWNREVIKTFGGEGDKLTPELADKAFNRLGKQFEALGKGKTITGTWTSVLEDNIKKNIDEAYQLGTDRNAIDGLQQFVQKEIIDNVDVTGSISGELLNKARAKANALARKATNMDAKILYRNLENDIIDALTDGTGKSAKAFSKTKQQYKNLLAVEPLFRKEQGGLVNPTLLSERIAKIYGREFTRGKAGEIGDLARIGRTLLKEGGGSDTFEKLALTAGAYGGTAGGGLVNAPITAAVLGTNRAFQSFFNRNQGLIDRLLKNDATAVKEVMKRKPAEAKMIMEGVKQLKTGTK